MNTSTSTSIPDGGLHQQWKPPPRPPPRPPKCTTNTRPPPPPPPPPRPMANGNFTHLKRQWQIQQQQYNNRSAQETVVSHDESDDNSLLNDSLLNLAKRVHQSDMTVTSLSCGGDDSTSVVHTHYAYLNAANDNIVYNEEEEEEEEESDQRNHQYYTTPSTLDISNNTHYAYLNDAHTTAVHEEQNVIVEQLIFSQNNKVGCYSAVQEEEAEEEEDEQVQEEVTSVDFTTYSIANTEGAVCPPEESEEEEDDADVDSEVLGGETLTKQHVTKSELAKHFAKHQSTKCSTNQKPTKDKEATSTTQMSAFKRIFKPIKVRERSITPTRLRRRRSNSQGHTITNTATTDGGQWIPSGQQRGRRINSPNHQRGRGRQYTPSPSSSSSFNNRVDCYHSKSMNDICSTEEEEDDTNYVNEDEVEELKEEYKDNASTEGEEEGIVRRAVSHDGISVHTARANQEVEGNNEAGRISYLKTNMSPTINTRHPPPPPPRSSSMVKKTSQGSSHSSTNKYHTKHSNGSNGSMGSSNKATAVGTSTSNNIATSNNGGIFAMSNDIDGKKGQARLNKKKKKKDAKSSKKGQSSSKMNASSWHGDLNHSFGGSYETLDSHKSADAARDEYNRQPPPPPQHKQQIGLQDTERPRKTPTATNPPPPPPPPRHKSKENIDSAASFGDNSSNEDDPNDDLIAMANKVRTNSQELQDPECIEGATDDQYWKDIRGKRDRTYRTHMRGSGQAIKIPNPQSGSRTKSPAKALAAEQRRLAHDEWKRKRLQEREEMEKKRNSNNQAEMRMIEAYPSNGSGGSTGVLALERVMNKDNSGMMINPQQRAKSPASPLSQRKSIFAMLKRGKKKKKKNRQKQHPVSKLAVTTPISAAATSLDNDPGIHSCNNSVRSRRSSIASHDSRRSCSTKSVRSNKSLQSATSTSRYSATSSKRSCTSSAVLSTALKSTTSSKKSNGSRFSWLSRRKRSSTERTTTNGEAVLLQDYNEHLLSICSGSDKKVAAATSSTLVEQQNITVPLDLAVGDTATSVSFDDLSSSCDSSSRSISSEYSDWASEDDYSSASGSVIVVSVAEAVHQLNKQNTLERVAASVSGLKDKIIPSKQRQS